MHITIIEITFAVVGLVGLSLGVTSSLVTIPSNSGWYQIPVLGGITFFLNAVVSVLWSLISLPFVAPEPFNYLLGLFFGITVFMVIAKLVRG